METPRAGDIYSEYGFVTLNMHGRRLQHSPPDGSESTVA